MTDLVKRLRGQKLGFTHTHMVDLVWEAAAKIERLEKALDAAEAYIVEHQTWDGHTTDTPEGLLALIKATREGK